MTTNKTFDAFREKSTTPKKRGRRLKNENSNENSSAMFLFIFRGLRGALSLSIKSAFLMRTRFFTFFRLFSGFDVSLRLYHMRQRVKFVSRESHRLER